jgi:hypothetical protein
MTWAKPAILGKADAALSSDAKFNSMAIKIQSRARLQNAKHKVEKVKRPEAENYYNGEDHSSIKRPPPLEIESSKDSSIENVYKQTSPANNSSPSYASPSKSPPKEMSSPKSAGTPANFYDDPISAIVLPNFNFEEMSQSRSDDQRPESKNLESPQNWQVQSTETRENKSAEKLNDGQSVESWGQSQEPWNGHSQEQWNENSPKNWNENSPEKWNVHSPEKWNENSQEKWNEDSPEKRNENSPGKWETGNPRSPEMWDGYSPQNWITSPEKYADQSSGRSPEKLNAELSEPWNVERSPEKHELKKWTGPSSKQYTEEAPQNSGQPTEKWKTSWDVETSPDKDELKTSTPESMSHVKPASASDKPSVENIETPSNHEHREYAGVDGTSF